MSNSLIRIPITLIFGIAAWSVVVPKILVGGVGVGLDDALAMLFLPCLLLAPLLFPQQRFVNGFWAVSLLFLLFFAMFFPLGTWSNSLRLGESRYATELWQYLKRLAFFLIGFFFVVGVENGSRRALSILFGALFVAMLIGVIQLLGMSLGVSLAELYARSDAMLERLVNRTFSAKRIYGTAGHPNAWGGFSVFVWAVTLPYVLASWFKKERIRFLVAATSGLAVINVLFSGSRGAIAALFVVSAIILLWFLFTNTIRIVKKSSVILVLISAVFFASYLFIDKLSNLLFRFSVLIETAGGGRDEQVREGLSVLSGPRDWLLGAGNGVQRALSVGHGVEVEPIYLLINYGLLGLSMLACILGVLFYCALRLVFCGGGHATPIGLAMISAILGYLTFSLGYFFFQELVVGTTFWLFSGVFLASYQIILGQDTTLSGSSK